MLYTNGVKGRSALKNEMKKNQKKTAEAQSGIRKWDIPAFITGLWLTLMFTVFPLIYDDYYFNILETKFATLSVLTLGMFALLLLYGIFSGGVFRAAVRMHSDRKRMSFRCWFKQLLSPTDLCVLAFFLFALIATANAYPYVQQAITGEEGRYVGMFYIFLMTGAYLCVSRFLHFHRNYILLFLCTSWIVCLLGITDFYNMNLLHFRDQMQETQYAMFSSTLGNINTYTAYVGIVVALSGTLFVLSDEGAGRVLFYFATMIISFMAMAMGESDNGYLTLAGFFGGLPFIAFRTRRGIRRYILVLAAFFTNLLYIGHVLKVKGDAVQEIHGLFQVIIGFRFLPLLAVGLWLLAMGMYWRKLRQKVEESAPPVLIQRLWYLFFGLCVFSLLGLLLYANSMSYDAARQKFGSLADYLKFRDAWGTQRGYVWRAGIDEYRSLSPLHKLTGTGPDTFGIYMMIHRWKEMTEATGQFFDAAHNEYIQYLFTVGPLGLLSHVGILVFAVREAFRKGRSLLDTERIQLQKSAYYYALGLAVFCYALQAAVNINIPIAAPLLWTMIMLAAGRNLQKVAQKKN